MDYRSGGILIKDTLRYGKYEHIDSALSERAYEKITIDLYDLPDFIVVCFYVDYSTLGPSSVRHYVLCPTNIHPQQYLNNINADLSVKLVYHSQCDIHTHYIHEGKLWYESVKKVLDYNLVSDDLHIINDCFHFQCIDIIMCNYNTRKRYQELSTLYDDLFTTEDDEENDISKGIPLFPKIAFILLLMIISSVLFKSAVMLFLGVGIFLLAGMYLLFIED